MRDNWTGQAAATRLTSHLSNLTVALARVATLVSGKAHGRSNPGSWSTCLRLQAHATNVPRSGL